MGGRKYGEEAVEGAELEALENPAPEREYRVEIAFPEFTCLCPRSGYPDFATIRIAYIPDRKIVELKSLKLYLNRFRGQSLLHEEATNRIYGDLWDLLKPKHLEVVGDFNPRGNVKTVIRVSSSERKTAEEGERNEGKG
jgi:7-cyano-7-deazaguanine reductase